MGRPIKKGSTDQSTIIRIIDSTDFTPENSVDYDTSGIDLWYRREGATKTSITEATLAALDSDNSTTGLLYWDLVQGASVKFTIKDLGIDTTETIPASSTVRLSDI